MRELGSAFGFESQIEETFPMEYVAHELYKDMCLASVDTLDKDMSLAILNTFNTDMCLAEVFNFAPAIPMWLDCMVSYGCIHQGLGVILIGLLAQLGVVIVTGVLHDLQAPQGPLGEMELIALLRR